MKLEFKKKQNKVEYESWCMMITPCVSDASVTWHFYHINFATKKKPCLCLVWNILDKDLKTSMHGNVCRVWMGQPAYWSFTDLDTDLLAESSPASMSVHRHHGNILAFTYMRKVTSTRVRLHNAHLNRDRWEINSRIRVNESTKRDDFEFPAPI